MRRKLYQIPKVGKTIIQSFSAINQNETLNPISYNVHKRKLIRINNYCLLIQDNYPILEIPSIIYNDRYIELITSINRDKRSLLPTFKQINDQSQNIIKIKLSCQCGHIYNSNQLNSFQLRENVRLQNLALIGLKLIEYVQLYYEKISGHFTNFSSIKMSKNSLLSKYCRNCSKGQLWIEPPYIIQCNEDTDVKQQAKQVLNTLISLIKEKNDQSIQWINFIENLKQQSLKQIKQSFYDYIEREKFQPVNTNTLEDQVRPEAQWKKLQTQRNDGDCLRQFQNKQLSLEFKQNHKNYAYLSNFRKTDNNVKKSKTSRRRKSPFFQSAKQITMNKSQLIMPAKKIVYIASSQKEYKKNNVHKNLTASQWSQIHKISTEIYHNYCKRVIKTDQTENIQESQNKRSNNVEKCQKDLIKQYILTTKETLKQKIDPIGIGVNQITSLLQKYNLKWIYPLYFLYKKFFYMRCTYLSEFLESNYSNIQQNKFLISEISQQNKSVYEALIKMQKKIEKHEKKDSLKKIIEIQMQESDDIYSQFVSFMVNSNVNLYENLYLKLINNENIQQLKMLSTFGNIILLASIEQVRSPQNKKLFKCCVNNNQIRNQSIKEFCNIQRQVLTKLKESI